MLYPHDLLRRPGVRCHVLPDGAPHVHEHYSAAPHPGRRVVAVCGKGGVGKSALVAMMARSLADNPHTGRLLVIDADPALGLALALGVEPEHVRVVVPLPANMPEITRIIREEIEYDGVSVIIPRRECMQTLRRHKK